VSHLSTRIPSYLFLLVLILSAMATAACADPVSPSYAVTDLGPGAVTLTASSGALVPVNPGGSVDWSTAGAGAQIVSVSNGQVAYPFTLIPPTPLEPYEGTMSGFPLATPAPVNNPGSYGNPLNVYSTIVSSALSNANGIVAAIDSAGVFGHQGAETVYYVQRNPDGSWGSPTVAWGGSTQFAQGPNVGGAAIAGINNLNQIVGTANVGYMGQSNAVLLYDINSHTLTNLSTLPAVAGYLNLLPIAIDDQGRILVDADPIPGATVQARFGSAEQTLLLTPDGVSADPLSVPAPEPGSIAVLALAALAFAAHHNRGRRSSPTRKF
jgi:hypothetical protein